MDSNNAGHGSAFPSSPPSRTLSKLSKLLWLTVVSDNRWFVGDTARLAWSANIWLTRVDLVDVEVDGSANRFWRVLKGFARVGPADVERNFWRSFFIVCFRRFGREVVTLNGLLAASWVSVSLSTSNPKQFLTLGWLGDSVSADAATLFVVGGFRRVDDAVI